MTGTVKKIDISKGYGFIEHDGHRADSFFHITGLTDGLIFDDSLVGRRVAFDVEVDPRNGRERAANVRAEN